MPHHHDAAHEAAGTTDPALPRVQGMLGDFAVPLPSLRRDDDPADPEHSVARLSELARDAAGEVTARIRIVDGDRERSWALAAGGGRAQVAAEDAAPTEVEVIVTEPVWRAITAGEVAPLAAFGQGGLRVRGDVRAAAKLVRRLRAAADEPRAEGD